MRLEASNRLGLTGLADGLDRLTDADGDRPPLHIVVNRDDHSRIHCTSEVVKQIVRLVQQSALEVKAGVDQHEHTAKSGRIHKHSVRVDRIQRYQSLAHVKQALRNSDAEHVPSLLAVELAKLTEQTSDAGVVGTGTDNAHGQDGIL